MLVLLGVSAEDAKPGLLRLGLFHGQEAVVLNVKVADVWWESGRKVVVKGGAAEIGDVGRVRAASIAGAAPLDAVPGGLSPASSAATRPPEGRRPGARLQGQRVSWARRPARVWALRTAKPCSLFSSTGTGRPPARGARIFGTHAARPAGL